MVAGNPPASVGDTVWSLVWADPTCCGAAKAVRTATDPAPRVCDRRGRCNGNRAPCNERAAPSLQPETAYGQRKAQCCRRHTNYFKNWFKKMILANSSEESFQARSDNLSWGILRLLQRKVFFNLRWVWDTAMWLSWGGCQVLRTPLIHSTTWH